MHRFVTIFAKNIFRVPFLLGKLHHYAKHHQRYDEQLMFRHVSKMMRIAIKSGNIRLQCFGQENIPTENGFMMYGNHQNLFDVMAIPATFEGPLSVVYKKELHGTPILKDIYTITRSFAMDRDDVRQSLTVIQAVTEEVKKGRNYLIFPEGTRSKTSNTMGTFHGGSFRCAIKAKCPIVPIAFVDCYKVFDQKGSRKVSAQIHYLRPVTYEEYKDLKTAEIAELVKSRVQQALDKYTV